jgi:Fe2+ transport system protein FeoA
MDEISLLNAPSDKKLKIKSINSGMEAKKKLLALGFHADDILIKLTNGKWGPLLIQNLSNTSSKTAIGRGLAMKIYVSVVEESDE